MALGDRNRLRGKPAGPAGAAPKVAAAKPSVKSAVPLVDAPAPKAEKAPVPKAEPAPEAKVSPPPRHKPEAAPKVVVEEPAASDSGEVTIQRAAPPKSEATVPDRPAPKPAEPVREEATQALSVSDMELVPGALEAPVPKTSVPVELPQASETATVAASPGPMHVPKPKILKFSGIGDTASIGELKFELMEVISGEMINVVLSGGAGASPNTLHKDQKHARGYTLKDGTTVDVSMTYTGRNLSGTALEVEVTVQGLKASSLSTVLGAAAKNAMETAPSKLRFAPSVITMFSGVGAIIASFTMKSLTSLVSWQQYGIAAIGLVAAAVGLASITARIDYNAKSRQGGI